MSATDVKADKKPGAVLKALRTKKGWKLAELAQRTGIPVSALSKMENGRISLSYDKLARLSKAMAVDIGVFFTQEPEAALSIAGTGRRSITRAGAGRELDTEVYHHRFLATDILNKRFIPLVASPRIKSMEEFGDWVRHSGEECTYIIEGALDFYSEFYEPVRLEAGDSIYFDSGMGHAYIAVGDAPCRVLTICSGDESQLASAVEKLSAPRKENLLPANEPSQPVVTRLKSKQKNYRRGR